MKRRNALRRALSVRAIWGGLCLLLLLIGAAISAMNWHFTRAEIERKAAANTASLQQSLDEILQLAQHKTLSLSNAIRHTDYDTHTIYALLRQEVDRGLGVIRYGWSNANRQLVAGSAKGLYQPPIDVSERTYLHIAMAQPNQLHTTPVIGHIVSEQVILPVVIAIEEPDGTYRGTLAGVINIPPLIHLIKKQLLDAQIDASVYAPDGTLIYANSTPALSLREQAAPHQSFHVVSRIPPSVLQQAFFSHCLSTLLISLVVMVLLLASTLMIRRLIITPVESTMTALAPLLPAEFQSQHLHDRLEQLRQLAQHYASMQEQLKICEQELGASQQMIHLMQQQQQHFMTASGQQMSRTFQAIADYTNYIEEQILKQSMDDDSRYYFDDVREMGSNLQLAAESFHHICTIKQGSRPLSSAPIQLIALMQQCAHTHEDALERRNQSVRITHDAPSDPYFQGDITILTPLMHCLLESAIYCSEDEAQLNCHLSKDANETWQLTLEISQYRRQLLPPEEQDFGAFMQRYQRDVSEAFIRHINDYMNICLARSFVALYDGDISMQMQDNQRIIFTLELPHSETPSAPLLH